MKILTKIGLVLLIIIAIPLIAALFMDKSYSIERSIVVNRPAADVFRYVRYLKNQDHYSKWVQTDPNMKKAFRGTDGTTGFVYAWDGNSDAGKGEQEITGIKEGEEVAIEVRFKEPMESIAQSPIRTEAVSLTSTKVTWGMKGKNKYPFNFLNPFMDGMLGKDLETSLQALKNILEK